MCKQKVYNPPKGACGGLCAGGTVPGQTDQDQPNTTSRHE